MRVCCMFMCMSCYVSACVYVVLMFMFRCIPYLRCMVCMSMFMSCLCWRRCLCCAHVASVLLNASNDQKSKLINYANHIGLAFQIADDLLDLDGNEYSMGKPVGQDNKNETPNFVTILGKAKAKKRAIEESNKAINLIEKFKQESENLVSLAKYTVNRNK